MLKKKCFDTYVQQELVVYKEHERSIRKNTIYFLGVGAPWSVGPFDLVTPVSMVVYSLSQITLF